MNSYSPPPFALPSFEQIHPVSRKTYSKISFRVIAMSACIAYRLLTVDYKHRVAWRRAASLWRRYCCRTSVCLSVCLSVTLMHHVETVQDTNILFSVRVFVAKIYGGGFNIIQGFIRTKASKWGTVLLNVGISTNTCRHSSKVVRDRTSVTMRHW